MVCMAHRSPSIALTVVLGVVGCQDVPVHAWRAQGPESEATMSEDARRMHERLVALSEGEGSISDLRIEFMDGSMASHKSYRIETGKLVSKEWPSPGSPMVERAGSVPDAKLSELLRQLIAKEYWQFEGTRFTPDSPTFLFRFYYGELTPVDFRCDAEEFRSSAARSAIRSLFLDLVSGTRWASVPANP